MALATKCPHCHTVFRVALDQLKLRGGIVRCGACDEIFDGNAALVQPPPSPASPFTPPPALDLELDLEPLPPPAPEPEPEPEAVAEPEPEVEAEPAPEPVPEPVPEPEPEPEPEVLDEERREPAFDVPSEHLVAVALDDLHHFDDAPPAPAPDVAPDEPADRVADDASAADLLTAAPESALLAAGAGAAAPAAEPAPDDDDEPEFVRRANRRARGAQVARLGMIAGVPLLAFLLLGQGVVVMRNSLAADHPDLKPALQALCAPLGCTVDLPRQIDALAIEQGELQTLAPNTYRFNTVLRNGGRGVQAWPHLELALNDAADKPVLRRVFAPRDYLGRPADEARGFAPRSEQPVKLYFTLDGVTASGYHIAIFYP